MFASLALTKMNCNRTANYFTLPVLFGLAYFNLAHYQRSMVLTKGSGRTLAVGGIIMSKDEETDDDSSLTLSVGAVELVLSNVLIILTIVQLAANLLRHRLSKVLN